VVKRISCNFVAENTALTKTEKNGGTWHLEQAA
jgi:hypothetical protein